jgi:membrane-associated phospholipid phosphatase
LHAQYVVTSLSLALVSAFVVTGPARAQPEPVTDVSWSRSWHATDVADLLGAAGLSLGILGTRLIPRPDEARWTGGLLMDDPVRDGLRANDPSSRGSIASASDIGLFALVAWPFVDAAIAWLAHDSPEVAFEMAVTNLQALALTYLVTDLTKRLVGRQRPHARGCADGAGEDCDGDSANMSFSSGHTSMSFAGAGLVCAHHENLPLYGGRAPDRLACYSALAAATAVGLARVASDKHYVTDVIFGAAVGLGAGYLMPSWLRYDFGEVDGRTGRPRAGSVLPSVSADGAGLQYQLVF